MKTFRTHLLRTTLVATAMVSSSALAQTWTGNVSNDFNNAANWSAALGTNTTLQINGPGTQGSLTLTNVGYTFTGSGGKIGIGDNSGAMVLSGGTLNFFNATNDAIGVGINNNSTVTIASDSILGDGATNTTSFTARNISTGVLRVTGNITGGSGAATPGALNFSLGSTAGNNGTYELLGNINRGGAANMTLTKRGTGTATLSGTNVFLNLGNNEAGSTIRINGGQTNILNAAGGGWGIANQPTSVVRVSGGSLNAFDSRNIRNSINVGGGTFNIGQAFNESGVLQTNNGTTGARLSFNGGTGAPAYTFSITDGNVNFLPAGGASNFGVRFGSDSGPGVVGSEASEATVTATQSGGTFVVNGRGGQDVTFSLGTATANKTNSYSLSGGILDVRGSDSTNGSVTLGGNATSGSAVLTVSGTGKLISRSNPAAANSGISGRTAGAAQVLALDGGTLVAGRIDAANLRGSLAGANGVIVNNGSSIAPGDIGTAGRTQINGGDLFLSSGSVLIDIFGTSAATTFANTNAGFFDNIVVSGALTYGGSLSLNFGTYTPNIGDSYDLFNFGSQSGTFSSIAFGNPGLGGTFDYSTGILTVTAIPEPSTVVLVGMAILGFLLMLRKRRRLDA